MVKYEVITGYVGKDNGLAKFDKQVKDFINELSYEGHAILSVNSISCGSSNSYIRTEILYREIETRKVITEKEQKND